MRHLKTYKIFESSQELTPEQESFLNKFTQGTWSINPSTGLVDIDGDFNCSHERLEDFKGIRFGDVSGSFWCYDNRLTTLEGAPKEVGGDFGCLGNSLTTLEGSPEKVGGNFGCYNNSLTTLEGAPREVGGSFYCSGNNLTTLEGAPETIGGEFYFNEKVRLPKGDWSIQSLINLYETLNGKNKTLVGTLVSPEVLQKRIDENPESAAVQLKGLLHLPQYKSLKWPDRLKSEVDLLSSLDGIGL